MRNPLLISVLFCSCALFELAIPAGAAPESLLSDYDVRQLHGEEGFVEEDVCGVDQSLDGYVWCVTRNQVLRFDGMRFTPVDRSGWPTGPFTWRGLCSDHRGALWLYGDSGVLKREGNAWRSFPLLAGPNKSAINAMEEDAKGRMWGAGEKGLYLFDGASPRFFPCLVAGTTLAVLEMDVTADGQILLIAKGKRSTRLLRFQDGIYHQENLPGGYRAEEVIKVHGGPTGTLWVATAKRLLRRSQGGWQMIPLPEGRSDWIGIRTLLERKGGELWVGTGRGLFRWRGEAWSELTSREGLPPIVVGSLKEDREGGLWAAGEAGLMRLTPKPLQVCLAGLGSGKERFVSLLTSKSEMWAGIEGIKPLVGTPGQLHPAAIDGFPENTTPSALLKDRDGSLWIGTRSQNLWHWQNGKSEVIVAKQEAKVAASSVTALIQDRQGKIWVGTTRGLMMVSQEGLVPARVWDWHPKDAVNAIYEDRNGTIWVGYQTIGLIKILRDGSAVWFQKGEGVPDNCVQTIYQDHVGVMWIGTAGGLVRWMRNRECVFTTAHGLVDDVIRQIIEDDFGYLWLGTRYGLMRVNQSEFSEVERGAKPTLAVRYFGRRDGMRSEECTTARPAKTADGKIGFPTTDGLVMADPKAIPRSLETPLVHVEEVSVGDQKLWSFNPFEASGGQTGTSTLRFPSRAREVTFRFAALDYFAPERVLFKYRIEGLNDEWSTPNVARTARFPNIPEGSYRFRVQSCSRDGVWSVADASIAFSVPPRLWQTVLFRAVAGVSGILVVVLLISWRERRKAHRRMRELEHEQTLERERGRIARDIHDEVGAGLTEVALLSELAQAELAGPGTKYLDDIFKTARDLTRSLDEIVWSINPANDNLEKLVAYLVEFARDFLGAASLSCRLEVPTLLPPVTVASTVRHQICLAVKETLNNVVRHAKASEVSMGIEWDAGRLRISISDNGQGFLRADLSDPAATHDGLGNVSSRMREINGSCEQQSGIGKGTRTVLSVEIPTLASNSRS